MYLICTELFLLQDPDFSLDTVLCNSNQNRSIKHKLIKCWFLKIFQKLKWFHAACSQKSKHFCLTIRNFIVYHFHYNYNLLFALHLPFDHILSICII